MQTFTITKTYPNGEEKLYCKECKYLFNKELIEDSNKEYFMKAHIQIHKSMNIASPDKPIFDKFTQLYT